ncbi:60S acidic ribosomal protein P1 [Bienertia sinuspersici]
MPKIFVLVFWLQKTRVTMSVGKLACTYAALILHDDDVAVTAEKIQTLVSAANISIESYWPSLFAKLVEKKNIEDLILNVGAGGGGGAPVAAVAGAGAAAAPAAEEKKRRRRKRKSPVTKKWDSACLRISLLYCHFPILGVLVC